MTTLAIECNRVVKRWGRSVVLDGVDWSVESGRTVGLIGASGAGKTTLLRIIAGLSSTTSGKIALAEERPGVRPRIGMAFQSLALWPHLTARQHLECVLSRRPRSARRRSAEDLLDQMRLPRACWSRRPAELSGGESQRLALARALAAEPQILLLDEPLAQLDFALKSELLKLIGQSVRERPITVVYVTHVWSEAASLCSRLAVMDAGRIKQSGAPEQLFWAPADRGLALLSGPLVDLPLDWLQDGSIAFHAADAASVSLVPAEDGRIEVRPQQLRLTEPSDSSRWRVIASHPQGAGWTIGVASGDRTLELHAAAPPAKNEVGLEARGPERFVALAASV